MLSILSVVPWNMQGLHTLQRLMFNKGKGTTQLKHSSFLHPICIDGSAQPEGDGDSEYQRGHLGPRRLWKDISGESPLYGLVHSVPR